MIKSRSRRVGDWRGFRTWRLRFQSPPVKPCMRFSRTRLTDVLHRRHSAVSPPVPEGPGRDDDSMEAGPAQGVRRQQHLGDAPPPAVAPVAFLGQPQPEPPESVVPGLAEDTGRVSVAEVPAPAAP